VHTAVHGNP